MTTHLESSSERAGGTLDRGLLTLVTVILAIWLAAAVVLAAAGAFAGSPTQPPLGILLAVVLPPLLFATLYRVSGRFQDFALAIDLRWLTAIQAWRVIGVMAKFALVLGGAGNVRTKTLKAFSETEYRAIIGSLA